jgi:hypothetical protein
LQWYVSCLPAVFDACAELCCGVAVVSICYENHGCNEPVSKLIVSRFCKLDCGGCCFDYIVKEELQPFLVFTNLLRVTNVSAISIFFVRKWRE